MDGDCQAPHLALQQLRSRLRGIHDAISNYQPLTAKPPILDSSLDLGTDPSEDGPWSQQEHISGLKKLRDSVKIDLDVLEKVWDPAENSSKSICTSNSLSVCPPVVSR